MHQVARASSSAQEQASLIFSCFLTLSFAKHLKKSLWFLTRVIGAPMEERGIVVGRVEWLSEDDDYWGERGELIPPSSPIVSQHTERRGSAHTWEEYD